MTKLETESETVTEGEGKAELCGSLNIIDVNKLFLKEIEERVFVEGETPTLKQLLREYEHFLWDHGIIRTSLRTFDIKVMLEKEFEEKIGFHNRYHKNESTLVFDKNNGGTFLEAAMHCWGVSDQRLFEITAKRLRENVCISTEHMKWPLSTAELCSYHEPHTLLNSFVKELSVKGGKQDSSETLFSFLSFFIPPFSI